MTGGGFGGCAMALVDAGKAENFAATVAHEYQAEDRPDSECVRLSCQPGCRNVKVYGYLKTMRQRFTLPVAGNPILSRTCRDIRN